MTVACRYPDRVDGVISVDSAPIDESQQIESFFADTHGMIEYMQDLSHEGLTRIAAVKKCRERFKENPEYSTVLETNMDRN